MDLIHESCIIYFPNNHGFENYMKMVHRNISKTNVIWKLNELLMLPKMPVFYLVFIYFLLKWRLSHCIGPIILDVMEKKLTK